MSVFTYQQVVQISNWAMLTDQAYEARPAAPLTIGAPWAVQVRAGHDLPWANFDLSAIDMTAVNNFLSITSSGAGAHVYGPDNPVGLSAAELGLIARYLEVTGAAKFARATDDGRVMTSPDGQSWTVYPTSTEFNFPAAQAAVVALLGHP